MTVRPILFSAPMVRSILREIERPGTGKTQTRRVLNPQPAEWQAQVIDITAPTFEEDEGGWGQWVTEWSEPCREMPMGEPNREVWRPLRGLRFAVGDVLWVRETWSIPNAYLDPARRSTALGLLTYKATPWSIPGAWRPSIHMPRWASRLTLVVTDVRVERLQSISETDAIAEGAEQYSSSILLHRDRPYDAALNGIYREGFSELWEGLNGARGLGWTANPWVCAVSFVPHAMNVDAFLAQKEAA